jgi:hypothetical protein
MPSAMRAAMPDGITPDLPNQRRNTVLTCSVVTTSGSLTSSRTSGSYSFAGAPMASSPTGSSRFTTARTARKFADRSMVTSCTARCDGYWQTKGGDSAQLGPEWRYSALGEDGLRSWRAKGMALSIPVWRNSVQVILGAGHAAYHACGYAG